MENLNEDQVRQAVRENYAKVVKSDGCDCGCNSGEPVSLQMVKTSCCSGSDNPVKERPAQDSTRMGYSADDLANVPQGSDMGLGCGNPQAIAALKAGETVLDLGSGGGFDSFLAANQVGTKGHVIGVDMTPEMVSKARENAARNDYHNVEFRLGEIEHLPVADNDVDVILSNCVINLSPDKLSVYREAFRILKPGGRLAISDMVAVSELPDELKRNLDCYCGCITGTIPADEIKRMLAEAGFQDISIEFKDESREFVTEGFPAKASKTTSFRLPSKR